MPNGSPVTIPQRRRGSHATDRRPHFVYELWGRDGCLYVGRTSQLPRRLHTHSKKWWWEDVIDVRAALVPNRTRALDRESERIAELLPLHNIQGVDVEARDQMRGVS